MFGSEMYGRVYTTFDYSPDDTDEDVYVVVANDFNLIKPRDNIRRTSAREKRR